MTLGFIIGGLALLIAAAVAHELTHAAGAIAIGGEVTRVGWSGMAYRVPEHYPRWVDRIVNLAPFGVGLVGGLTYLAVHGLPPPTQTTWAGIAAWVAYSHASPADLTAPRVDDAEIDAPGLSMFYATSVVLLGWFVMLIGHAYASTAVWLGRLLVFVGLGQMVLLIISHPKSVDCPEAA